MAPAAFQTLIRGWIIDGARYPAFWGEDRRARAFPTPCSSRSASTGFSTLINVNLNRHYLTDGWIIWKAGQRSMLFVPGRYSATEVVNQWNKWKPLLIKFSKSKNINKRRASIVFFCSPLSKVENKEISQTALQIVDTLKAEREVLITKAISWILRSMVRYNRKMVEIYLKENAASLPKIALRETLVKLETGKKTKKLKA